MRSFNLFIKNPWHYIFPSGPVARRYLAASAALLFPLFLISCGSPDPDCGGAATQDLIIQIIKDHPDNKLINYAVSTSQSLKDLLKTAPTYKANEANRLRRDELLGEMDRIQQERNRAFAAPRYQYGVGESLRHDLDKVLEELCTMPVDLSMARYVVDCSPMVFKPDRSDDRIQEKGLPRSGSAAAAVKRNEIIAKIASEQASIVKEARDAAVYKLDAIRMITKDSDTKAVSCVANLYVQFRGGGAKMDINFKVEKTTDGKLYATVYGCSDWLSTARCRQKYIPDRLLHYRAAIYG